MSPDRPTYSYELAYEPADPKLLDLRDRLDVYDV